MGVSKFFAVVPALLVSIPGLTAAQAVRGVVVTNDRAPVSAAAISLIADHSPVLLPEQLKPLAQIRSATDGAFEIPVSTTAPVSLLVSAPGLKTARFPLDLNTIQRRQVGIMLSPGSKITGTVESVSGKPIQGALLGPVMPADSVAPEIADRFVPLWTTSSAGGAFTFDGLPPGMPCHFVVRAAGYQSTDVKTTAGLPLGPIRMAVGGSAVYVQIAQKNRLPGELAGTPVRVVSDIVTDVTASDETEQARFQGLPAGEYTVEAILPPPRFSKPALISLPRDADTTVNLPMSNGYFVSGSVLDADTGVPAEGCELKIFDEVTTSDSNGHFRAGPLWIVGSPTLTVLKESGFRNADEGSPTGAPLPDTDGFRDIENLTVRVRAARTLGFNLHNYASTTRTVTIHLLSSGNPERRTRATSSTTDIELYSPGDFLAYAEDGTSLSSEIIPVAVRNQVRIPIDLTLASAAALAGRVTKGKSADATPAQAEPDTVTVFSSDEATSDVKILETAVPRDGCYSFPLLPVTACVVEAHAGTRTKHASVKLQPGLNGPVNFEFGAGRLLAGKVKTSDGRPVVAATLRCFVDFAAAPLLLETDTSGRFSNADIETDRLSRIEIAQVGYKPARRENVPLPAQDLEITLEPAAGLRAVVQGPQDSRWSVSLIETVPSGKQPYPQLLYGKEVMVDLAKAGVPLELPAPRKSRYVVTAKMLGENDDAKSLIVSEPFRWDPEQSKPMDIPLKVAQPGRISGDLPREAPEDVAVTAINTTLPESGETQFSAKMSAKHFDLQNLPPGDYLVTAIGQSYAAQAINVEVKPGVTARPNLVGAE